MVRGGEEESYHQIDMWDTSAFTLWVGVSELTDPLPKPLNYRQLYLATGGGNKTEWVAVDLA
jgi:hypothetical protein